MNPPVMPGAMHAKAARWLLGCAALLTLLIYAGHAGDYFFHDSAPVLEENPSLNISGAAMDEWRTAASSIRTGRLGRPVSMVSFAANHVIAGELDPVQVKMTNVLVHLLTGLALYLFLSTVLLNSPVLALDRDRAILTAALAAAIWLLHPLHVSTVLYSVQRMTQLAVLFTFLGLWHLVRLRAEWLARAPGTQDYSRLLLVGTIWTLFAGLAKENGLLLPLLAAVVELTLFRFRTAAGRSQLLAWLAPGALLAFALAVALFPVLFPGVMQDWYANRNFTLGDRLATQVRMVWHYLSWILLPDITAMGFNHDDIPLSRSLFSPITGAIGAAGLLALGAASWLARDRAPLLGFAVLWYLVGHSMESTIVPLEMVYEHRNYLPAVGPLLLAAGVPLLLKEPQAGFARLALFLFLLILVPLLFLRSAPWSSEQQLADANYRNHPESLRSRFNLATAYYEAAFETEDPAGRQQYFAASRLAALKSLELKPDHVPSLVWLILLDSYSSDTALVTTWQARLGEAVLDGVPQPSDLKFIGVLNSCIRLANCPEPPGGQEAFLQQAVQAHPKRTFLRVELAAWCLSAEQYDCARREAEAALARRPDHFRAYEVIYQVEQAQGRPGRASETARRLLAADRSRRMLSNLVNSSSGGGSQ